MLRRAFDVLGLACAISFPRDVRGLPREAQASAFSFGSPFIKLHCSFPLEDGVFSAVILLPWLCKEIDCGPEASIAHSNDSNHFNPTTISSTDRCNLNEIPASSLLWNLKRVFSFMALEACLYASWAQSILGRLWLALFSIA